MSARYLRRFGLGGLGLAIAAVALAEGLVNLPPAFTFPQGKDSPGKVSFSHKTHVSSKKPDCTECHPGLFKILEPGKPGEGGTVTHEIMKKGRACGACHDEERTFGLNDCDSCHEGAKKP